MLKATPSKAELPKKPPKVRAVADLALMAARFAEYERLLAEDEERKRAIESKGLVIGALPAWAKTAGLGPSPLGGAAEGGRAREGDVVLRPSEQKDDGPTNSWGFD